MVIDQNVAMIVVHRMIVQPVVPTEIATHVHLHAQARIVHPVHTVTDRNDAMIVVRRMIVQPVVHTEIAIHEQVPVLHLIVQLVVHTVTEIHVRHRAHFPIVANAVTVHVTLVQVLIARVAKTHTVVIAHAQAMIAMPVRLRVTANAEAVQIGPEVVSPMIAKSVHVVALAKSA
jgi:hypothetical protein